MKKKILLIVFFSAGFFVQQVSFAQIPNCTPTVPVFYFDFTSYSSTTALTASSVTRSGNCCGTNPPDICVLFVCTTGVNTTALVFAMANCPLPPGSIFYQLDCGPQIMYGDTAFISTPGIHYITYCKPGSIVCDFNITAVIPSIPTGISHAVSSDITVTLNALNILSLDLTTPSSFVLNIFSAEGKKVSQKDYSLDAGQHQINLSTQNLAQGIYFCRIMGENVNRMFKFVR